MGVPSEEPSSGQDPWRRRIRKGCQGDSIPTQGKSWLYHCGSENVKRYLPIRAWNDLQTICGSLWMDFKRGYCESRKSAKTPAVSQPLFLPAFWYILTVTICRFVALAVSITLIQISNSKSWCARSFCLNIANIFNFVWHWWKCCKDLLKHSDYFRLSSFLGQSILNKSCCNHVKRQNRPVNLLSWFTILSGFILSDLLFNH